MCAHQPETCISFHVQSNTSRRACTALVRATAGITKLLGEVVLLLGGLVLLHAPQHGLAALVELAEPVGEDGLSPVLLEEGVALAEAVELRENAPEQRRDARMVRKHQTGNAVRRGNVGRLARERHLDRGRAPGDEGGELALADAEEGFVDLEGRISLNKM